MTGSAAPAPALPATSAWAAPRLGWLAAGLIAIGTVAAYLCGPLAADVAWLITVCERMLAGQQLYVDILETNPPMAALLYMPPVLPAHWLGCAPEPLVVIYTVLFGLLATGFAAHVVAANRLLQRAGLFWAIAMLLLVSAWGEDFAQREHFAAMAALPLIAVIGLRATGRRPMPWVWIVAGLCGGLVLTIKPHFALGVALPLAYAMWRRRSLSMLLAPELWLAAGLLAGFTVMTWLIYPAFFTNILPAAGAVYIPDRRDLWTLVSTRAPVLFEAILLLAVIGFRREAVRQPLLGSLFAAGIGFGLCYLVQGKGFTYQLLPGIAMLSSFLLLAFAERADGRSPLLDNAVPVLAALVLAAMPMLDNLDRWRRYEVLTAAVAPYGPGLRFANLTSDLRAASPLHRLAHGDYINASPALLMSLGAHRLRLEQHPDPAWLARIDAAEAAERTTLREDMARRPPDIIVTAREGIDWLAWAREDAGLEAILAGYEPFATVPFDQYDLVLLKRRGLTPRH